MNSFNVFEYNKNLINLIRDDDNDAFFLSYIKFGSFYALDDKRINIENDIEKQEFLKLQTLEFWNEVSNLIDRNNKKLFDYILKNTEHTSFNFEMLFKKATLKGSEDFFEEVIVKQLRENKIEIYTSNFLDIINRKSEKISNLSKEFINWEYSLRKFKEKETINYYLDNKVSNLNGTLSYIDNLKSDIRSHISHNLDMYDNDFLVNKDILYTISNHKNVKNILTPFYVDYFLMKELLNKSKNLDNVSVTIMNIAAELYNKDPNFDRNMKFIFKKYKQLDSFKTKLKLHRKLMLDIIPEKKDLIKKIKI